MEIMRRTRLSGIPTPAHHIRNVLTTVFTACILCTFGCNDLGVSLEPLSLSADGQLLQLTNSTEETLYYFIVPTALVSIIDWVPCREPESCPDRVPPYRTVSVAYESFWWLESGREYDDVTIYWWRLVSEGEGRYRDDRMQFTKIRIR